jgi:hypothetical protein
MHFQHRKDVDTLWLRGLTASPICKERQNYGLCENCRLVSPD